MTSLPEMLWKKNVTILIVKPVVWLTFEVFGEYVLDVTRMKSRSYTYKQHSKHLKPFKGPTPSSPF